MVQPTHFLRVGLAVVAVCTGPHALAQTALFTEPRAPSAPWLYRTCLPTRRMVIDPADCRCLPWCCTASVFADTPVGVESGEVDWRSANDDVGQFRRGHMDILKWESMHEGKH